MKTVLILACVRLAAGQALSSTTPANDGIVVKTLQFFAPAQPGTLTADERWRLYLLNTFGPAPIISAAASSGISQWVDSPPEWGQGGEGYGKRVANHMAYGAVRNSISHGLAALLHEDNRYFASGKPTTGGRILYAVVSPVRTRRPSGRDSVSISSISGIVGASLISRAWSPHSWRSPANVGISIGLTLAGTAGFNVFREFVPSLTRVLRGQ